MFDKCYKIFWDPQIIEPVMFPLALDKGLNTTHKNIIYEISSIPMQCWANWTKVVHLPKTQPLLLLERAPYSQFDLGKCCFLQILIWMIYYIICLTQEKSKGPKWSWRQKNTIPQSPASKLVTIHDRISMYDDTLIGANLNQLIMNICDNTCYILCRLYILYILLYMLCRL